jgi:hypothetical protein
MTTHLGHAHIGKRRATTLNTIGQGQSAAIISARRRRYPAASHAVNPLAPANFQTLYVLSTAHLHHRMSARGQVLHSPVKSRKG